MSFFNSLQQVVSDVTTSVSNLSLSPRRFSFNKDPRGSVDGDPGQDGLVAPSGNSSVHTRAGGGRLGPKCIPTPGSGGPNLQPRGSIAARGKLCTGNSGPQSTSSTSKKKEKRPLPVLQCGDRFTFWPEYDPSQTWVGENDDHWFEKFTSLGWHHNEALKLLRASHRQSSKDVPSDVVRSLPQGFYVTREELENLYGEVLYTIRHKIGAPVNEDVRVSSDLAKYSQNAFHIEPSEHSRLFAVVQEEKPPILVLNLVVVEAEGLEAKDPNGFSDPYCMLGIQPQGTNHPNSPRDSSHTTGSPPPDSPRNRGQGSRSSQETESESDGDRSGSSDSLRAFNKENLRKHHSFRLSFKRRTPEPRRDNHEHRDSLTNDIPVKLIRATSVRSHTLSPRWNEKFRLDIDDISTDILHLDIWDHDDESSVFDVVSKLNEVKGVKGLGRFFKQIAQSARSGGQDDFLGCVNIPLQDLPSTGIDKWYPLEARSQRSNVQGQIHLKMWLSTREDRGRDEEEAWKEVKQHYQIMCVFIQHELVRWKDDTLGWDGNISSSAEAVLHQHALQGDLTALQQAVARWQAYSRIHVSGNPLDHRILHRKIVALHDMWDQDALCKEEEEMLTESFQLYVDRSLEEIRKHREVFPTPSKTHVLRLDALLRSLALLGESSIYWKVCPFHKEIRGEVLIAFRRSAHERYMSFRETKVNGWVKDAGLEAFSKVVLELAQDLQAGLDYYEHTCAVALKIPYVSLNYKIFEKQIAEDAVNALESIQINENSEDEAWKLCSLIKELELNREVPKSPMDCTAAPFRLYLALAEFSRFQEHVSVPERRSLILGAVWTHFFPSLSRWLDVASWKLLCRSRRAILSDRVANTGEPVQYTTSAVDTTSGLYHVKTFWRHLSWPEVASGYTLMAKLLQVLGMCADYYVGLLQQRLMTLSSNAPSDERARQLCITVNNMEHVRNSFTLLQEELQLDEFSRTLETQDPRNGRMCAEHLQNLLQGGLTILHDRISESMTPVAERMRIELHRDVFHLAWSPDSLPADEAVRPLLEHLHTSLTQYATALLKNNLDRLLALLWHAVLVALLEQIGKDTEEKQGAFFTRLYDALQLLREFFYANERGLDASILCGEEYEIVEKQLRLHKTPTDQLIEMYHLERLYEQDRCDNNEFGSLFVRVYFNHDSLCVEVLQARNVIPLDPNGLSDPFVVVELLPRRLFPGGTPQHTNVHKKTLNPLFDECFEFPATLESCQSEGAMILFTLMDHDVITCNDFGGEAFLSLNLIPGVASTALHSLHGLKPIELFLMFRKDPENSILRVLETRTNDKLAQEFVKKQKQRLKT